MCLSFLSVVANTTAADASQLLVIQALVPFRTHSSPSCRATVEAAPASLPLPGGESERNQPINRYKQRVCVCLPGSLRQKQPTFSPVVKGVIHCFFCSSVPFFRIGPM